jgi:hypothetical protein
VAARLCCGRVRPHAVADRVKIDGDERLADAILAAIVITP